MMAEPTEKREKKFKVSFKKMIAAIATVDGDGISQHDMTSIGKYTVFPRAHYKRMFPTKSFGRYEETDMARTETYGIMCRE